MRWKEKLYEHGEKRIIEKFAYFPIYIHDVEGYASIGEWRWLEKVKIEQRYFRRYGFEEWENIRFID